MLFFIEDYLATTMYSQNVPILSKRGEFYVEAKLFPRNRPAILLSLYGLGWTQKVGFKLEHVPALKLRLSEAVVIAGQVPVQYKEGFSLEKVFGFLWPEIRYKEEVPSGYKNGRIFIEVHDNHCRPFNAVVFHLDTGPAHIPGVLFTPEAAARLTHVLTEASNSFGENSYARW
jgi:hypothetical protein